MILSIFVSGKLRKVKKNIYIKKIGMALNKVIMNGIGGSGRVINELKSDPDKMWRIPKTN